MNHTKKWMVVPYNPSTITTPNNNPPTVAQSLSKVMNSHKDPFEKVNDYSQILAKNKDFKHPVIPDVKKENIPPVQEFNNASDQLKLPQQISTNKSSQENTKKIKFKLPNPRKRNLIKTQTRRGYKSLIAKQNFQEEEDEVDDDEIDDVDNDETPMDISSHDRVTQIINDRKKRKRDNTLLNTTLFHPKSPKKTRAYKFFEKNNYYERPDYALNSKTKTNIIELEKPQWSVYN